MDLCAANLSNVRVLNAALERVSSYRRVRVPMVMRMAGNPDAADNDNRPRPVVQLRASSRADLQALVSATLRQLQEVSAPGRWSVRYGKAADGLTAWLSARPTGAVR